ncbi:MAG: NAD(P)H-hydrate epimerase [Planctomycetia bacterium]|nr:NAD(P)H-hydrate epimerase [Planctomycetia bacterium]
MLTRQQVRELDQRAITEFGIPGIVLMENAGRGVVDVMLQLNIAGPVHIVCGKGNNGGDGFVIARHLDVHGIESIIHRCCAVEELTGDAAINYRIVEKSGFNIVPFTDTGALAGQFSSASWIVDALLGTGLTGEVREPFRSIIYTMNESGKPILAVDLPSGLDADTGGPLGIAVKAQHTVTFVATKKGFQNPRSTQYAGEVHVAHIGVPQVLLKQYGLN